VNDTPAFEVRYDLEETVPTCSGNLIAPNLSDTIEIWLLPPQGDLNGSLIHAEHRVSGKILHPSYFLNFCTRTEGRNPLPEHPLW
jgi:hypothetical protein